MPKVKMPRKSTAIDMTAMCDVAFLLLTFFMLATKFKPDEPVAVVTPSSINTQVLPDSDVMLFTVDKDGRVFFSMDGQPKRRKLIEDLNTQYKLGLNNAEMNNFAVGGSIGTDFKSLKSYLSMSPEQRKASGLEKGIPTDSLNGELDQWIEYGTTAQAGSSGFNKLSYCIKADNATPYPKIKEILDIFKKKHIQKLNLVTNLEAIPPGTAAALAQQESKQAN
ncbi:outer membrane transport energization protein ExbD [Chitinophaga costaii]|uniref:Outer membrane transport energization protein ExbD n=1 Tax=Chitinophaga costaii TaxID=1335309 RepID=A0A1C4G077_9BACT|nr:biopolymer transporter ExbD [Chitinophaga costaii]PUZ19980.1 biopolymer transporter ExbD [Chitinophaga costaii]SCC61536.1 outer membrane transport energization protein ExbD [Chitinophaga costaii]